MLNLTYVKNILSRNASSKIDNARFDVHFDDYFKGLSMKTLSFDKFFLNTQWGRKINFS